jgi:hypothetical protein
VVANVLLDKAVSVMAADHGIGQVHVLDLGLQLAAIVLGDPAAKDHCDLVRLSDGSITAIDKCLQNVLLHVEIVVVDRR